MQLKRIAAGFTLTELAVVMAIIALLIGGTVVTLSARVDMRDNDETTRRLNAAVDALNGYAVVNRRLPCPALANTTGDEALTGSACTTYYGGFLPARTIGFQPTDSAGYALDAWGNRIRYAVANNVTCTGTPVLPHFVSQTNLKANGISCKPNDLDICNTAAGSTSSACASQSARVVSTQSVAFLVFSTGKNGAMTSAYSADESENTDADAVFVTHTPGGTTAYDDLMVFVTAGAFYSKLIAAGVLP